MSERPLDPFAVPSQTALRFVLLMGSIVGTSVFAFNILYFSLSPQGASEERVYSRCWEVAPGAEGSDIGAVAGRLLACVAPYEQAKAVWVAGGLALLFLVAGLIYWYLPAWRIRRLGLRPLRAEDAPDHVRELDGLVAVAGLARPPTYLWRLTGSVGGVAFGRYGRRYLGLDAGLVTKLVTDRAAFRAIVLHELAHLRNADVDRTYLTVAFWRAFVIVALVPVTVSLADEPDGASLGVVWRLLFLLAVVYLTRNAVLRSRETYADVRAAMWEGGAGGLEAVLSGRQHDDPPSGGSRHKPFLWGGLVRRHFEPQVRLRLLRDPEAVFAPGFWESFGAGLATTIVYGNLATLLWLAAPRLDALVNRWLSALLFAPLAMGVVAVAVWRWSAYRAVRGRARSRLAYVGLGLGLGLVLGQPLSAASAITGSWSGTGDVTPLLWLVSAAVTVACACLIVRWIATTAAAWLPVIGRAPIGVAVVPIVVAASCLFACWFGVQLLTLEVPDLSQLPAGDYLQASGLNGTATVDRAGPWWLWLALNHPLSQYFSRQVVIAAALVGVWAVPLAAWLVRPPAHGCPSWLTRLTRPPLVLTRPAAAVRLAVLTGVGAAVAYAASLLAIRFLAHQAYTPAQRALPGFALLFNHWQVSLAILLQAVAATIVACVITLRRQRFAVVLGMMAAFLTGAIGALVMPSAGVLGGCLDAFSLRPGPCAWDVSLSAVRLPLGQVTVVGSLAALVAALVVHWLARSTSVWSARATSVVSRRPSPAAPATGIAPIVPMAIAVAALTVLWIPETVRIPPEPPPATLGLDPAALEACDLLHRLPSQEDLRATLLALLDAADRSTHPVMTDEALAMRHAITDGDPQAYAFHLRRLTALCPP
ncbi:M48 family metalloprotease [Nonomuraea sp. CA-143628]|uniref:M48 family metalloprotease n=1 Tax=Nonomuraea sp. CA-143628 TaxID=3239997 RepID=UPI003D8A1AA6